MLSLIHQINKKILLNPSRNMFIELHLSVFILKSLFIKSTSCNTAEDILKAQAILKQYVYSASSSEVETTTKTMYEYLDNVFNDEENEYNMIDDIHQLMNAELKEIETSLFTESTLQENTSQSVISTCKIEWMMVSKLINITLCVCVCAVSYTHLDVYKRQTEYCECSDSSVTIRCLCLI